MGARSVQAARKNICIGGAFHGRFCFVLFFVLFFAFLEYAQGVAFCISTLDDVMMSKPTLARYSLGGENAT